MADKTNLPPMRKFREAGIILGLFCFGCILTTANATAQTIYFGVHDIALKSGESAELADVYYISHDCKSLLKAAPEVEILDGPPGVTAAIKEDKIVPRTLGCTKPVPGGKLIVTASEVEEYGRARLVLRVKLKTSQGDRQWSRDVNITLIPPQ
jgi:hypothetical protein